MNKQHAWVARGGVKPVTTNHQPRKMVCCGCRKSRKCNQCRCFQPRIQNMTFSYWTTPHPTCKERHTLHPTLPHNGRVEGRDSVTPLTVAWVPAVALTPQRHVQSTTSRRLGLQTRHSAAAPSWRADCPPLQALLAALCGHRSPSRHPFHWVGRHQPPLQRQTLWQAAVAVVAVVASLAL